eukprot:1465622-Pyramimonas_sp.AAC.1
MARAMIFPQISWRLFLFHHVPGPPAGPRTCRRSLFAPPLLDTPLLAAHAKEAHEGAMIFKKQGPRGPKEAPRGPKSRHREAPRVLSRRQGLTLRFVSVAVPGCICGASTFLVLLLRPSTAPYAHPGRAWRRSPAVLLDVIVALLGTVCCVDSCVYVVCVCVWVRVCCVCVRAKPFVRGPIGSSTESGARNAALAAAYGWVFR